MSGSTQAFTYVSFAAWICRRSRSRAHPVQPGYNRVTPNGSSVSIEALQQVGRLLYIAARDGLRLPNSACIPTDCTAAAAWVPTSAKVQRRHPLASIADTTCSRLPSCTTSRTAAQVADPIYHVQDNKVGCAPLYCIQNNKVGDASPLYGCWRNKVGCESSLWHSEQ